MANRYWVGGSGTWNATSTTNWSASSGGAGGASAPTSVDDVFFDQATTYTVTCGATTCKSLTVSAGTVTFATGTSVAFNIYGSLNITASTVWSATGTLTFRATTSGNTITTNGVAIGGGITLNGAGGEWTLGSNLAMAGTTTSTFSLVAGNLFATANYNISNLRAFITGSYAGTISFGASTFTYTNAINSSAPLTLNNTATYTANTCTFDLSYGFGLCTINNPNAVYNLIIRANGVQNAVTVRSSVSTGLVLNNLTIYGSTAASTGGYVVALLFTNITVNGTFSTSGTSYNNRVSLYNTTSAMPFSVAAASLADIDFACLAFTGAAAPLTGTRLGKVGNVSGVTFNAGRTVYWNQAAGGAWTDNAWAASSGGTPSTTYFPLPQDTAVIENTGLNTSATITFNSVFIALPTINSSTRTNAATISLSGTPNFGGSVYIGSGVTIGSLIVLRLYGDGDIYVKNDNTAISIGLSLLSQTSTCTLLSNISAVANSNNSYGSLNLSSFTLTCNNFTFGNSVAGTSNINFGSGTLSVTGSIGLLSGAFYGTNIPGTGKISFTNNGTPFFGHGNNVWPIVELASTATGGLFFSNGGTSTVKDLRVLPTVAVPIIFNNTPSITFNSFTPSGTAGNLISFSGPATLTKGSTWYVGANSVNVSGNTGLVFTAGGGVDYLSFQDITGVVVVPPYTINGQFFTFFT